VQSIRAALTDANVESVESLTIGSDNVTHLKFENEKHNNGLNSGLDIRAVNPIQAYASATLTLALKDKFNPKNYKLYKSL